MRAKKSTIFVRHALSALRAALVWARKGGAPLKRTNHKWLEEASSSRAQYDHMTRYGGRQLSLDETPAFHFKIMHRPRASIVEFDDHDDMDFFKGMRKEDYICEDINDVEGSKVGTDDDCNCESESSCDEQENINSKADEFIAKFYADMRQQRQISCFQYDEIMLEI